MFALTKNFILRSALFLKITATLAAVIWESKVERTPLMRYIAVGITRYFSVHLGNAALTAENVFHCKTARRRKRECEGRRIWLYRLRLPLGASSTLWEGEKRWAERRLLPPQRSMISRCVAFYYTLEEGGDGACDSSRAARIRSLLSPCLEEYFNDVNICNDNRGSRRCCVKSNVYAIRIRSGTDTRDCCCFRCFVIVYWFQKDYHHNAVWSN